MDVLCPAGTLQPNRVSITSYHDPPFSYPPSASPIRSARASANMFVFQNKVDIKVCRDPARLYVSMLTLQSMSEQDQKALNMYGKAPAKNLLTKMQKVRRISEARSKLC